MAERYITLAELEARVGGPDVLLRALPPLGPVGVVERVGLAREGVEQKVTAALAPRYGDRLPATPDDTGEVIKLLVSELVLCAFVDQLSGHDEVIQERHQAALVRLSALASGELVLPTPESSVASVVAVDMDTDGPLGPDDLQGWIR